MAPVIIPDLQPEIENGFPLKVKTAKESSPGESCVVRRASCVMSCPFVRMRESSNFAPCHVLLCPFVSLRLRILNNKWVSLAFLHARFSIKLEVTEGNYVGHPFFNFIDLPLMTFPSTLVLDRPTVNESGKEILFISIISLLPAYYPSLTPSTPLPTTITPRLTPSTPLPAAVTPVTPLPPVLHRQCNAQLREATTFPSSQK